MTYNNRVKLNLCQWKNINETTRWPVSDAWDASSNQSYMLSQFEQQRRALHDHVDLAFRASSMNEFSKTVEIAHGWIHGIIGGGWLPGTFQGHMWPLEYSAYEPLFMLHHTSVFVSVSLLLCI
jgi:tyrosinase